MQTRSRYAGNAEAAGAEDAYLLGMAAIDSRFMRRDTQESRSASDVALSLVLVVIGYEWLVSGFSKIANGDFAHGLAADLGDLAKESPAWYGDFLRTVIVPHAVAFGYLIEFAELAVGIVLVSVAFTDLAAGSRRVDRCRSTSGVSPLAHSQSGS